jgi:environmental stress-induced protein Ves
VKIVRASDCRQTPWKNGGGSTTEIAAAPAGASLDNFDWRISVARVASDGPFSEFAGVDRTLTIVRGSGLALTIDDASPVLLDAGSDPFRFAADAPIFARLRQGEIIDLNVMTRRRRFDHHVRRIRESALCDFNGHDVAVVVACHGTVALDLQREPISLSSGDAAILIRASDPLFQIIPTASADCVLVLLRRQDDQDQPG